MFGDAFCSGVHRTRAPFSSLLSAPIVTTNTSRAVARVMPLVCRAVLTSLPLLGIATDARAQEPVAWGHPLDFATFSIAAIDPRTGESGVAVTTRVPCVGNGVPWVRAGVGAVATQANTRTEYGSELLDRLAAGLSPDSALELVLAADTGRAGRQVGVIAMDGRSATYTGSGTTQWAGGRQGRNYVTQGNLLVSGATLDAVAATFEASEGAPRHLADRLIDAIAAGHAAGGDARKGRSQSAAVIVADPRPGRSRRSDKVTANINVCEHPEPVTELRRIYNTISQTLGYRELQSFSGNDVWQLKVVLHALGFYRPAVVGSLVRDSVANEYTAEAIAAIDAFRASEKLAGPRLGSPSGLVDRDTVERLWAALARAGKAEAVKRELMDATAVRR
jgi:uncharacterized Ntn-hydrolase superfamily protein